MGEVLKAIWFVTRKYPPTPGGMEKLARQIASALTAHGPFVLVRWSRSQWGLPLFMAWAAFRILCGRASRSIAVLYLGDPVLSALGMLVRKSGIPVVVTVHGLDVLFPSRAYQRYLRRFFWNRFDGYVCISQHVADILVAGGVPTQRIRVLPPGIDLARSSGGPTITDAGPARLLLLGRLVARKGAAWFVGEVLPKVVACHPDVTIAIVGEGPERPKIEAQVAHRRLHQHVQLCGRVDDATIGRLLAECTAVVMPNIPIGGDTEGFGLVALEAGAVGNRCSQPTSRGYEMPFATARTVAWFQPVMPTRGQRS